MRPARGTPAVVRLVAPLAAVLLAGCSMPGSMNPVDWWHSAEGGRIAEERPPPPNADAPYPNLGTVPPKPVVTDAATRTKIASGLVADRANAQYAGSIGADPSSPATAPQAFGRGTAPPPAPPASSDNPSAKLQAATASPPAAQPLPPAQPPLPSGPPTPPSPAPVGKVAQEPLTAPPAGPAVDAATVTASAAPPAGPAVGAATVTASAAPPAGPAVDAATVTVPAAPPPAPHIAGVDVPAITAPTPPPFATPVVETAPVSATIPAVLVAFQPGSVVIAPQTQDALRNLARRSGAAPLEAIGYGDAASGDPAAGSAALPLALARARAIAAVLTASGVPSALVHVDAEAEGHGGAARIAN